ncbi:MAG: flagellar biosynthesis protein FlhA, partial [Planctomycetes bacterium]|nr:flagellar biosynthesis protein FlhA [Planctomycetota bacterium]
GELLSREDLNQLVDRVRESAPAVIDDLIPNVVSMGLLHRILTILLNERVPITNLTRILESLASHAPTTKDPDELAERIRRDLARAICEPFTDERKRIHAIVFDPLLELELRKSLHDGKIALGPEQLEKLIVKIAVECREASQRRQEVALLVDTLLRRPVRNLLSRALPDLSIIAFSEVPNDLILEPEVVIKVDEVFTREAAARGVQPAGR